MANENNDISEIVKKCKILLLDIEGTTTSISFVKDKLFPYAEENVKEFLDTQWEIEDVKEAVSALRKLAIEDQEKSVDGVVPIPGEDASKEDQIEGLVKSVKWHMSLDRKVGALKQLQGLIWKQGYDKGDIKGHVYDDVSPALELWRSVEGNKVYIYSSGSVQAQKLLFGQSASGDLLPFIDGHFDTAVGAKQEAGSYNAIAEKIGCKPDEILFLTDILKEAEAAREAGVNAALVSREGNAALAAGADAFPRLYSLAELANTNKRKPAPQDEQPAKIPKTDVDGNVKTNTEVEKVPETETEKVSVEAEKMEVEDEVAAKETIEKIVVEETVVEEVTNIEEVADAPVCEIEPVIEESVDKTDEKETEKMETESSEKVDSVSEPKVETKNGNNACTMKETPPTVITEIVDVTNDKENLSEVAEIIEDLVPIVEEPTNDQEMETLQNVGEVLEKECDEILSKVQDVTNLDNIPLKPLLNPIAEETMETENTDTNDIVEGILDSEMERDMKQCGDIDLNTVDDISDVKPVEDEGKGDKLETVTDKSKLVVHTCENKIEDKVTDKVVEKMEEINTDKVEENCEKRTTDNIVKEKPTEEKSTESITLDQKPEENKPVSEENKVDHAEKEKLEIEQNKEIEEVKTDNKDSNVETNTSKVEEKTNITSTEVNKEPETNKIEKEEITTKPEKRVEITTKPEESVEITTKPEESVVTTVENNVESSDSKTESQDDKTDPTVDKKANLMEPEQPKENKEIKKTPVEQSTMETDTPAESKETASAPEKVTPDSEAKAKQVNGKTTNGDADMVDLNGDVSKNEELSSRLSMENGKEAVNGANSDSTDAEQGQSAAGAEPELPDIKVKTVAADEPQNDPIQPTEA